MAKIYHRNGIPVTPFNRDRLRIACDVRGVSLSELSEITGLDRNALEWFSRFRPPTLDQVTVLASALRFPVAFFYAHGQRERVVTWMCCHTDDEEWLDT